MQSQNSFRRKDTSESAQYGMVVDELLSITASLLRKGPQEIDATMPFIEMGADSIGLALIRQIRTRFGVDVSIRRIFEDDNSVQTLARHIERALPAERPLSSAQADAHIVPTADAASAALRAVTPFVPYKPIQPTDIVVPSSSEQQSTRQLMDRYTAKTHSSRKHTEKYRPRLADNRASAGFRLSIKEMLYPLHAERSLGSKIYDLDGNEFLDLTMGFGANLFGHNPEFVMEGVRRQMELGIQIGPQSPLAGEVAELVAGFTGMDRVAFCNSGTEAVMTALRLARTATGKSKIALFAGSYHGTFDGVLARAGDSAAQVLPIAPGVPPHMVEDVIVLDYAAPNALEIIQRHASELAAVLVEPVQSRRPDLQPRQFLQDLRAFTRSHEITLIFDEIITGFRLAPGGAQEWFDVRADMATYGKVIGGGLPIGLVAGREEYMNGIDGGQWSYGDDSYPSATTTFFAGTFCKHPLTLAASKAALLHMKDIGPELQKNLNRRTSELSARLNEVFAVRQFPVRVVNCGSLFRFTFAGNMDLFFYHLLDKGIYIWEGRNCFLSTVHTDADLDHLTSVVCEAVWEMKRTV
jgi:glutamate-1-semialdehyde aminotransferase